MEPPILAVVGVIEQASHPEPEQHFEPSSVCCGEWRVREREMAGSRGKYASTFHLDTPLHTMLYVIVR